MLIGMCIVYTFTQCDYVVPTELPNALFDVGKEA